MIDVTIAASVPVPTGTAFAPHLMQGERVLFAFPAVTSATTTIGYKCPDMSGLTLRVRAAADGCTGPLGPPAPALVIAPVITRAAVRGTTLDLSWKLPPDAAGAISTSATSPSERWVNVENQRSVEVVVNDRGPFVRGRHIDLSPAAARAGSRVTRTPATMRRRTA